MTRSERRARTERANRRTDSRWEGCSYQPIYKLRDVPSSCRCDWCLPAKRRARQNEKLRALEAERA